MQDNIIKPLNEAEVVRLVKFIRQEEENEHIAQLCADVCSEFARIARFVGKVGFVLSDEWKSADHLVLNVKEHKSRLLAIHIRATGNHDEQGVDVSEAVLSRRRETARVSFSLPAQFSQAKTYIMGQLFESFPKDRLVLPVTAGEKVSLFEDAVPRPSPTWDESVIKQRAQEAAALEGEGKFFPTPYADDNVGIRSFRR